MTTDDYLHVTLVGTADKSVCCLGHVAKALALLQCMLTASLLEAQLANDAFRKARYAVVLL